MLSPKSAAPILVKSASAAFFSTLSISSTADLMLNGALSFVFKPSIPSLILLDIAVLLVPNPFVNLLIWSVSLNDSRPSLFMFMVPVSRSITFIGPGGGLKVSSIFKRFLYIVLS